MQGEPILDHGNLQAEWRTVLVTVRRNRPKEDSYYGETFKNRIVCACGSEG